MDDKTEREKRLAAALRDNLKRRKAAGLGERVERDGKPEDDRDQT